MRAYRAGWLAAAAVLIVIGVLTAAAQSWFSLLVLVTLFALVGAVVVLLTRQADGPRATVTAIRRWLGMMSGPSDGQVGAVLWALSCAGPVFVPFQPPPESKPASDDQLLSQAWCDSFDAMESTASPRKLSRIVEERGQFLDELERRNPAAFAAWLASATPADDLLPYLSQANVAREPINWDDLVDGHDF